VDAASFKKQLWSQSFDRKLTSLLDMQRELSFAIADQVRLQLSPERFASVSRRHTRDAAAYDFYLRGRRLWNQLTPASTRMAIEYYSRATSIDPTYALAWAGIAEAFASAPINGDADPLLMWPHARAAAEHAVRANPRLSEAQHVSGQVQWFFEWDFRAADGAFRKAVALDPSNAWAHSMFGHALSQLGQHDEARSVMDKACMLEPLSPLHHAMASQVAFQGRDMALAAERAQRAIVMDPEFWVGHMMRGQACEQLGEFDLALDALATAARLSGGNSKPVALRGYLLARLDEIVAAGSARCVAGSRPQPVRTALRHGARLRGPAGRRHDVRLARTRPGCARRPSRFPARRSEVGPMASRAATHRPTRTVWIRPRAVSGCVQP